MTDCSSHSDRSREKMTARILLHACCGPCETYPLKHLLELRFDVTIYFYNPNIYPKIEYQKRLTEAKRFAQRQNVEFIAPAKPYRDLHREYLNHVENAGDCEGCWKLRIDKTAAMAIKLGIKHFTTTLLVSPHQDINRIRELGENAARSRDLKFYYPDPGKKKFKGFRTGFTEGREIAHEHNLYCQTYCGCEASIPQSADS